MNMNLTLAAILKLGMELVVCALLLSACSSGSSSSGGSSGPVTGVATPSKVSVVNTN